MLVDLNVTLEICFNRLMSGGKQRAGGMWSEEKLENRPFVARNIACTWEMMPRGIGPMLGHCASPVPGGR